MTCFGCFGGRERDKRAKVYGTGRDDAVPAPASALAQHTNPTFVPDGSPTSPSSRFYDALSLHAEGTEFFSIAGTDSEFDDCELDDLSHYRVSNDGSRAAASRRTTSEHPNGHLAPANGHHCPPSPSASSRHLQPPQPQQQQKAPAQQHNGHHGHHYFPHAAASTGGGDAIGHSGGGHGGRMHLADSVSSVCTSGSDHPPASTSHSSAARGAGTGSGAHDNQHADAAGGAQPAASGSQTEAQRKALVDSVVDLYLHKGRLCGATSKILAYTKERQERRAKGGAAGGLESSKSKSTDDADDADDAALIAALAARGVDALRLVSSTQQVQRALKQADDHSGWTTVRSDKEGLRVMHRHEKGSDVHSFKILGPLEGPVANVIALAKEFDLVPTWCKFVTESAVLSERDMTEMAVLATLWMPWPFPKVDILMETLGTDLLEEEGCFVITFATPDKVSDAAASRPPASGKRAAVTMLPGSCMKLTPLPPLVPGGPPRIQSTVLTHVTAGKMYVPDMIITFILKVLSPYVYFQVVKLLDKAFRKAADPLPARMASKPEFYGLIAASVQRHFARLQAQGGAA